MEELLAKATGFVEAQREKTKVSYSTTTVLTLLAGLVGICLVCTFAFKAWSASREKAKLLHEKAVREEEVHQAEVELQVQEHEKPREAALEAYLSLQNKIESVNSRILQVDAAHESAIKAIHSITSWSDVDKQMR